MGGGNHAGGQGHAKVRGGLEKEACLLVPSKARAEPSVLLWATSSNNFLCMSLGGSLGSEPLSGDPETLVSKKLLPGLSHLTNTLSRCVFFSSEIFHSDLGFLCSGLAVRITNTRLFRFYLSYLAPTIFPETQDGFARNNGIEKNVWTGRNHFSVRRY